MNQATIAYHAKNIYNRIMGYVPSHLFYIVRISARTSTTETNDHSKPISTMGIDTHGVTEFGMKETISPKIARGKVQ